MRKLIFIFILFYTLSCQQDTPKNWVAKYKDHILTSSDIQAVIPKGLSEDDSLQFVNQHIEKWVKDRILMSEVDDFLTEEEINRIEVQVASYREDLTESMIEDKLMLGFSDEVSEKELISYYEQFPDTFVLKESIITYRLLEVPQDSANKFKSLLRNGDLEDLELRLKTNNYYYDFTENNWVELDKLLATDILPEKIKKQNLLDENQIFTSTDNNKSFIIQIDEIGKKGNAAPYTFIKPTIKSVLLNKRKLNLLSEKKHKLYEKALENHEIKKK